MDMHRKYNENTEEIQAKYRVKTGEKNRGDTGGKQETIKKIHGKYRGTSREILINILRFCSEP